MKNFLTVTCDRHRQGKFSPFWKACQRGHRDVVELMLSFRDPASGEGTVDVSCASADGLRPDQAVSVNPTDK